MPSLPVLILLVASLMPVSARGAAVQPAPSPWAEGNRVVLGITQEQAGVSAQWRFERTSSGDIRVEVEESRRGREVAGSVLFVGSVALALRDLRPERGRELDALNGPLAMLQLAMDLLARAYPLGPGSVSGDATIRLADDRTGIRAEVVGMPAEFFAPWSASGTVGPAGGGRVRFELEFTSANRAAPSRPYRLSIAGIWERAQPAPTLPDSLPLKGWRVHQIRPEAKRRGQIGVLGLGTSAPMLFSHLGALRKQALAWTDEGARRARFQCN